jgi:hypothetical protein
MNSWVVEVFAQRPITGKGDSARVAAIEMTKIGIISMGPVLLIEDDTF